MVDDASAQTKDQTVTAHLLTSKDFNVKEVIRKSLWIDKFYLFYYHSYSKGKAPSEIAFFGNEWIGYDLILASMPIANNTLNENHTPKDYKFYSGFRQKTYNMY
jgi:hypothetical protein